MSIFVAVAAYCDPWLWPTIKNGWQQAKNPEQLVFGVFEQNYLDGESLRERLPCANQVRYNFEHVRNARGVCWARDRVFSLYGIEDYVLQVDSHTCFEPNWDETLVQYLAELLPNHPKVILTGYPMGCSPQGERLVPDADCHKTTAFVLRPVVTSGIDEADPYLAFVGEDLPDVPSCHYPGIHLAGGFLFTTGRFVDEIPYDPRGGTREEGNMAIRAYTHGWDIFHPKTIPLYHFYNDATQQNWEAELYYSDASEAERREKINSHSALGRWRMTQMLTDPDRAALGVYGLGKVRSLDDFARFSGIDYRHQLVLWRYPYRHETLQKYADPAVIAVAGKLANPSGTGLAAHYSDATIGDWILWVSDGRWDAATEVWSWLVGSKLFALRRSTGKCWLEQTDLGAITHRFVETTRTPDYVEITDLTRSCSLRLALPALGRS